MSHDSTTDIPKSLMNSLHRTLIDLNQNPYPQVENPEGCKKRASVALVLRIRPNYNHWPPSGSEQDGKRDLEGFFAQSWVQEGDAEIVFIKRAARQGDRWTSHVALPGGKRDPEDENDQAVAVRETAEEIGLDLTSEDVIPVGNLPQRVISTSWGKVP